MSNTKPLRSRPVNIDTDPCDLKTWNARRQLARTLVLKYDVDGVMFDGKIERVATYLGSGFTSRQVIGYLYGDRKGRFDHGWFVYSSLIKKVKNLPEGEVVKLTKGKTLSLPKGVKLITTAYSKYLLMPS